MAISVNGAVTAAAAVLGVVSTALGIFVTYDNQAIKRTSDQQALTISDQGSKIASNDAAIRQRADVRADMTTERDYTLKVYEKVMDALVESDPRRQQVALALVLTLPDAILRERLSGAFQQSPTVSQEVKVQAQQIREAASVDVAQQRQLQQAMDPHWNYDVFWCAANPQNQITAARVRNTLASGPNRRVRLREGWTPEMNGRSGYQAQGLEIRAEPQERSQAEVVKTVLDEALKTAFTIKVIANPTPGYLSIFVCS